MYKATDGSEGAEEDESWLMLSYGGRGSRSSRSTHMLLHGSILRAIWCERGFKKTKGLSILCLFLVFNSQVTPGVCWRSSEPGGWEDTDGGWTQSLRPAHPLHDGWQISGKVTASFILPQIDNANDVLITPLERFRKEQIGAAKVRAVSAFQEK